MPIINSDIRLIEGDITSAVEVIKEHLTHVGYKIIYQEITQKSADVTASILKQSVIKLYLTNSPQEVYFHLDKKSNEQVQIVIKCDLLRKFRTFYYAVLILLLIGSHTFMISNFSSFNLITQWESHLPLSFAILTSLFCFISACAFYMRSISTFPYEYFMNQFYESLIKKGFSNKCDIHVGHSFPDRKSVV